tara:strand:- start:2559 stop:3680 length:1122 start_codon:yes stop_codon:yes gene_type:complete
MELTAKTLFGLETVLAEEIKNIGGKKIDIKNRAVKFKATLEQLYLSNIKLRTSTQILLPIKKFKIFSANDLYKKSCHIKWNNVFDIKKSFSIKSTINSKFFNHSNYPSLLLKDAIVDQFRKTNNKRPNVDIKNPDIKIDLHVDNQTCTISLDSSGDLLYKRGYRKAISIAPINEVLAAGIILLTGWRKSIPFFDPMCGSGTFLIEALMMARNIPPNLKRTKFGFSNWKNYDHNLFQKLKEKLSKKILKKDFEIFGSDNNQKNIRICRKNIYSIFEHNNIKINNKDFFETRLEKKNFILFNPPYGQRIRLEKDFFYQKIGNHIKHNYLNSEVWIFSQNTKDHKLNIGLRPSKKIKLFNGGIECTLNKYEIFSGK